jgi:hypothetical protein
VEPLDLSDGDEGRSAAALVLVFTSLDKYNATTMNSLGFQPVLRDSETVCEGQAEGRTRVNGGRSALWLLPNSLQALAPLGLTTSKHIRSLASGDGGEGGRGESPLSTIHHTFVLGLAVGGRGL